MRTYFFRFWLDNVIDKSRTIKPEITARKEIRFVPAKIKAKPPATNPDVPNISSKTTFFREFLFFKLAKSSEQPNTFGSLRVKSKPDLFICFSRKSKSLICCVNVSRKQKMSV
jgi:hypothetical protein